ncbi:uncharacterized protein [Parasteatoda tepidariorum]|uniref:uncharacterized protein n=1 Tax=Parasteatoda tepidariorum TaxID=114398 RepID=UPI0039BC90F8
MRLNQLWKKLLKDEELQSLYKSFLIEYADLQHMQLVVESLDKTASYFLPYHGVLRPDSKTTKLRVVFNASSGLSLNDILYKGGTIQQDLFSILLRFRQHAYVFTPDISKMFRQILIYPDHRNLQLIFWKNSVNDPVRTFKLNTVTYGTSCAPYLVTRTIKQLAIDEGDSFPKAAAVIIRDTYMDDIFSSSSDFLEFQLLQLRDLFKKAGMSLRKWCTNTPKFLNSIPLGDQAYDFFCEPPNNIKSHGVIWNPNLDYSTFKVDVNIHDSYTKRKVLSTISRLFDPLGFLGPILTKAKLFLQKLWILRLEWDEPLPDSVAKDWQCFASTLPAIENMQISRHLGEKSGIVIHGFLYMQTISGETSYTRLLCSKSRVSPVKPITIPRLELCASVLLAQLLNKVLKSLTLPIQQIMLWTDSTIVLAWLPRSPDQLKTFISNRVKLIQELT